MRYRAFTLLELLVVVAIIALLIAMLVPGLSAVKEKSNRVTCSSRLGAIGKGFLVYASQEPTFPAVPPPKKLGSAWNFGSTGVNFPVDPISYIYTFNGASYPTQGNAVASVWLLVLQQLAPPKTFICPSDLLQPFPADILYGPPNSPLPGTYLNFGIYQGNPAITFSYSFAYPWHGVTPQLVSWWRGTANGSLVLAADIGPSLSLPANDPNAAPGTSTSNSKNHNGAGQNVLFADDHVAFSDRSDVGPANDCIYTANGGVIFCKTGGMQFNLSAPVTNLNVDPDGGDGILVPGRP